MHGVFTRRLFSFGLAVAVNGSSPRAAEVESREAFRDFVIAVGRRRFPGMPFEAGDGVVISGGHTLYLDNIRHIATMALDPRIIDGVEGRYLTISKGDGYDASRILLPRFRKRLLEKLGSSSAFPRWT